MVFETLSWTNIDLPQVYFGDEKIGKGKIGMGESEMFSCPLFQADLLQMTVSSRLITDDEIDLGQVQDKQEVVEYLSIE